MFGAAFRDKNRKKVVYLADKKRRTKAAKYSKKARLSKHVRSNP